MCVDQCSIPSTSGCRFYVTFIDDYSTRTWIYLINTKDEVFSKFREFKALVENQTEKKIKFLRSDNGGEYTSNSSSRSFVRKQGLRGRWNFLSTHNRMGF
jgi:hypothetical protein